MNILGIESSCDETGVAVVTIDKIDGLDTVNSFRLRAQALHSQVDLHQAYGGVVPELASRDHVRRLLPLLRQTLSSAQLSLDDIHAVAYTRGPGLAGALLVGASFAEALAMARDIPAIPVHHLEGHLLSPLLSAHPPTFPFVALLVSGGHTQLLAVKSVGDYTLLGETRDDAVGEAFDKTAKLLGLGYPGGPALAALADRGQASDIILPRPLIHSPELDFSFSGLKTAVLTLVQKSPSATADQQQFHANIAYAFQEAVVAVLVKKSITALQRTGYRRLVVAGGVSANIRLRSALNAAAAQQRYAVYYPEFEFCTDNGAMIALVGALRYQHLMHTQQDSAPSPSHQQVTEGISNVNHGNRGSFSVQPRWPLTTLTATAATATAHAADQ